MVRIALSALAMSRPRIRGLVFGVVRLEKSTPVSDVVCVGSEEPCGMAKAGTSGSVKLLGSR